MTDGEQQFRKGGMPHSILICDDEPHVTQLMGLVLREAGFTVRTASHGRMAFEMAAQDPPDLVVTDFQMPLMNGLELAMKLRTHDATAVVPVIMLTSRSHRLNDEEMGLTSIVKLLPKPFSPREVTLEVTRVLEAASPPAEAA